MTAKILEIQYLIFFEKIFKKLLTVHLIKCII
nr:MAG TPA: hypothetical protein [Caudoviricetes sp.]